MNEKDRSASALLIGRVHVMTRRWWRFRKAPTSHTPSASKRSLSSSFSADCHIVCNHRSSFPRDLENGQNNMPSVASDSSRVLLTVIGGTRYYFRKNQSIKKSNKCCSKEGGGGLQPSQPLPWICLCSQLHCTLILYSLTISVQSWTIVVNQPFLNTCTFSHVWQSKSRTFSLSLSRAHYSPVN